MDHWSCSVVLTASGSISGSRTLSFTAPQKRKRFGSPRASVSDILPVSWVFTSRVGPINSVALADPFTIRPVLIRDDTHLPPELDCFSSRVQTDESQPLLFW